MRQNSPARQTAPAFPPVALVDGQPINTPTQTEAVRFALDRLREGRGFTLFTLNLDHLVKRRADARFSAAYSRADIVTADGQPVVTLARRQGARLERTTGADLVAPLCAAAETAGVPVYFFGSSEASLQGARDQLLGWFPRLDIRGCVSPPMGFDIESPAALDAGRSIAASGARLCFLALGAPKQELFADRMAAQGDGVGYVCIGAALDFISGKQHRAPYLFQRTGLEWAYRLANNPVRLGLRYARCARLYARLRFGAGGSLPGRKAVRPAHA